MVAEQPEWMHFACGKVIDCSWKFEESVRIDQIGQVSRTLSGNGKSQKSAIAIDPYPNGKKERELGFKGKIALQYRRHLGQNRVKSLRSTQPGQHVADGADEGRYRISGQGEHDCAIGVAAKPEWFTGALLHQVKELLHTGSLQLGGQVIRFPFRHRARKDQGLLLPVQGFVEQ